MKNKGFIFDLDGVIVDTAKYHFLAWRKLANTLGVDFDETLNEQLKGVSRVRSLEKILSWGGIELSTDDFESHMAEKNEDYLKYIQTMTPDNILPGVMTVLSYLMENNIPFALGSASKNAKTILKAVGLFDAFKAIVDGNDVSKAKPDPEVFLIAAERLGVEPENCIVFEDSVAGVQAANIAGMVSVGIGNKTVLHEADVIYPDFTNIELQFIKDLISNESRLYKTQ